MSETTERLQDGLLAIADSVDKLALAIHANRPVEPTVDAPLRCTVANVSPAAGWRVLIGEYDRSGVVYSQIPMLTWITKVVHALSCDDVVQTPIVWDGERQEGVELATYIDRRRCSSPGVSFRILCAGETELSPEVAADFEAEIHEAYLRERRSKDAALPA